VVNGIEASDHLELSERDSLRVLELLENPPMANAKLRKAAIQLMLQAAKSEADRNGAATMESVSAEIDDVTDAATGDRSRGEPPTRIER
jgi:hypothetical protein